MLLADRLLAVLIDTSCEQFACIGSLDGQIAEIERRLQAWYRQDNACQRIAAIPGAGSLTTVAQALHVCVCG